MATGQTTPLTLPASTKVRILYRDGGGTFHLDWPFERIEEAIGDATGTLWLDVQSNDVDVAWVDHLFRDVFRFHPLAIDDALQENHVPKIDDWGSYIYTVFHACRLDPVSFRLDTQELDVFLSGNYLVTYHVGPIASVDRLCTFLTRDGGERMVHGPDHVLYHLFDFCCSEYLAVIEELDEAIDDAQDEVFNHARKQTLQRIFAIKRAASRLNRIFSPQREVFNKLARDQYGPIDTKDRVYFRDVYDHMVRLHDVAESLRDLISGALDTYLSAIANRTNDTMKVLTIVSMLFLPLNFLVGFFGMNFFGANIELSEFELPHKTIFVTACLAMVSTPWGMWLFGKRRGWF